MNLHAWYLRDGYEPKTHHKRTCSVCISIGNVGCCLPFRRLQKVRRHDAIMKRIEPRKQTIKRPNYYD